MTWPQKGLPRYVADISDPQKGIPEDVRLELASRLACIRTLYPTQLSLHFCSLVSTQFQFSGYLHPALF